MKPAGVKELKKDLAFRSREELLEICLRLSKFKKENKELLTYLLFEASNEAEYVERVKQEVDGQFAEINIKTSYFIKKSIRKILRNIKKHIRYSGKKETEVELLIYFCLKLKNFKPSIQNNKVLQNIYERELALVKRKLPSLHEDLQYDFEMELQALD